MLFDFGDKALNRNERGYKMTERLLLTAACLNFKNNAKYVPVLLEVAKEREVPFQVTRLETKEEAQNAPIPVTTYALF